MNNYILEGTDFFFLESKEREIRKERGFFEADVHRYDLEEHSLEEVLEDLDTYSLFANQKVIVIYHPIFLEQASLGSIKEESYLHLLRYLQNPKEENLLFFITPKVTKTLKKTKEISAHCQLISVGGTIPNWEEQFLEDYEIEKEAKVLLLQYCSEDMGKLKMECEKLKMYCLPQKKITLDDVRDLVSRKVTDKEGYIFELTNALVKGEVKRALEVYYDLLDLGNDPFALLGLIHSQYKILSQVKILTDEGLRSEEIAKRLNANPYRIKKVKENIYDYSMEELETILKRLAHVDLDMKSTNIEPRVLLELFILENEKPTNHS